MDVENDTKKNDGDRTNDDRNTKYVCLKGNDGEDGIEVAVDPSLEAKFSWKYRYGAPVFSKNMATTVDVKLFRRNIRQYGHMKYLCLTPVIDLRKPDEKEVLLEITPTDEKTMKEAAAFRPFKALSYLTIEKGVIDSSKDGNAPAKFQNGEFLESIPRGKFKRKKKIDIGLVGPSIETIKRRDHMKVVGAGEENGVKLMEESGPSKKVGEASFWVSGERVGIESRPSLENVGLGSVA
ncbi:hypothetical protein GOBAR_AA34115 [Gossypium barbadense]|uniref:Uncharacterized protein n=1 Tax=Gossypium barbadense TaxID=3634 RepID=A0A2P5W667_GOSBA|nr:hypothetical protein GOBAR_AA34115 [Gossypium barbadense]